jgi:glucan biosynthesis protein C
MFDISSPMMIATMSPTMSQHSPTQLRTYAIDNLRTFLTILVVLHHAALAYGGTGSFGYRSPYHPPGSSIALTAFNVLNQTFFMALFFLLSGYFSSIAARKRTRVTFITEKMKRLGVPTLMYSLFGKGIIRAMVAWRVDGSGWAGIKREFVAGVKSTRGAGGPTWFTALLLVFDVLYTLKLRKHFAQIPAQERQPLMAREQGIQATPKHQYGPMRTAYIVLGLSVAAMSSFLIRLRYPFGHVFVPLSLTLGYLPQYVLYYSTGIYIQRHGIPLNKPISFHAIITIASIALGLSVLSIYAIFNLSHQDGSLAEAVRLAGGGSNVFACLYAFQNEYIGFLFSSVLTTQWTIFGIDIASGSYATFLIHIPVLVETMTEFDEDAWKDWSPVIKTVVVGVMGVVKSWVLGLGVKWVLERAGWRGYL